LTPKNLTVFLAYDPADIQTALVERQRAELSLSGVTFVDYTIHVPIDSGAGAAVKPRLRQLLAQCDALVYLTGPRITVDGWLHWQMDEAGRLGLPIRRILLHPGDVDAAISSRSTKSALLESLATTVQKLQGL
jgi:hypothetical protein